MRTYFLILLLLLSFSAYAGIYKWVDDQGKVHYSDKEQKGAEKVNLPAAVTYTPVQIGSSSDDKPKPEEKQGYTEMSIVQPKMNETIRSNSGDVSVSIDLKPGLVPGHTITLYLDGKEALKGGVQTTVTLTSIDRGSHTLRATVFDKNGVAVRSSRSIIFHLIIEEVKPDASDADNSEAFKPDYPGIESKPEDKADFDKNFKNNFGKDFDSSGTYKDKAKDFKTGVPSSKGNFSPGSTFTPNYNQKK